MPTKFISEIIPISEIQKWKNGDRILITGQTGCGKSQFIKDVLYKYCLENNKKILLLTNRILLKKQNLEELDGEKSDIIKSKNYQTLETSVLFGNSLDDIISEFDYVIMDEVHYLLSDSQFNANTDILLFYLRKPSPNKINIFITATPHAILKFNNIYEYEYTLVQDYSFIDKLYFYNKDETVNNIISDIPLNEKVLYFGNALDSFVFFSEIPNSQFICSSNNREFKKKSDQDTVEEIVTKNAFSCRALFSTKVLDNGVNIISPALKHIIIDMTDPIDLIQCLGRKRIVGDEKINVYIKNQNRNSIYLRLKTSRNRLKLIEELNLIGKEEFLKKYARKEIDNIIMNDGEINWAKVYYNKYTEDIYSKMMGTPNEYENVVRRALGTDKILIAENYFEKKTLTEILTSYLGKHLYNGIEQEDFKSIFFESIFNLNRKLDVRSRGVHSINSILEEDKLPFRLLQERETKGENKFKRYWKISEFKE